MTLYLGNVMEERGVILNEWQQIRV